MKVREREEKKRKNKKNKIMPVWHNLKTCAEVLELELPILTQHFREEPGNLLTHFNNIENAWAGTLDYNVLNLAMYMWSTNNVGLLLFLHVWSCMTGQLAL